jgi:hypothetical protein
MTLMDWTIIGIFILSLLITLLIFLKLVRPSNWFKENQDDTKR